MKRVARKPATLADRIDARLSRLKGDVFLRADFDDLGGYDQVGVALRRLVRSGKLVRIGQGLYARAEPSILDGKPVPTKGVRLLMSEAMGRLGVPVGPTRLERAYEAGRTTQVPSGRVLGVGRRVRRSLGYNGMSVSFERV